MTKYHYNIEQRTEEWFALRNLKMTASNASIVVTAGKGLTTYCRQLFLESILPNNRETFISADMERGILLEPDARNLYQEITSQTVDLVAFVEHSKYVGCSPDGLIGKDGGLEIKCAGDKVHLGYILDGEIPKDYYNQVQMCLLITKRKWWDLAFYNPNFPNNPMIINRILPDLEVHDKLKKGFKEGEKIIKEVQKKFLHKNKKITCTKKKIKKSKQLQNGLSEVL